MDLAGVCGGVAVTPIRTSGFDSGYTVAAGASDPRRLVAVGNVDVLTPDAPETLANWVHRGMRCARFYGGTSAADWRPATADGRLGRLLAALPHGTTEA